MAVKVKYKTKLDITKDMLKNISNMNGKRVEVGCFNGDHAWLAGIHEYGCNIKVTPKMRAYLHSKGLHLKESTSVIKIPERSFLRSGHDECIDEILNMTEKVISQVISGKMSSHKLIDWVGEQMATHIKEYAASLSTPPNHPYTVDQKGSSNPLNDTGGMINGISWRTK